MINVALRDWLDMFCPHCTLTAADPFPLVGLTVSQFGAPLILHDVQLVVMVNEELPPVASKARVPGDTSNVAFVPLCITVKVWVGPQPVMVNVAVRDWVEVFCW